LISVNNFLNIKSLIYHSRVRESEWSNDFSKK
jgi:hypothetical protein